MTETIPTTALDLEIVRDELLHFIAEAAAGGPRSLQKRIGPSEIGIPCARRIGYKLADVAEVNKRGVPWYPFIGTAVHASLADIFEKASASLGEMPASMGGGPRFLVEKKVTVGQVLGEDIDGSSDVFDRATGTVIDWKIVGGKRLLDYKRNGPGPQYRVQGHTYGRGWQLRGEDVQYVAVFFLPRDRQLDKAYFWHESYDETVALKALDRVEGIAKLTNALGPAAAAVLPTADAHCQYCPWLRPGSTNVAEACPGDPKATAPSPSSSLQSLIA